MVAILTRPLSVKTHYQRSQEPAFPKVNIMPADYLATSGVRASADMLLILFY